MEQINVDLIIQTADSAKNLGELKKSMVEVRQALDKVEVGSKSFKQLNEALDDGAEKIRSFRSGFDTLKAFDAFGRTIATSFGLASGVIAEFSDNNENLQRQLLKVQAALTIVQSFSGLVEAIKAAKIANDALNASLLTNPYVLVAGGIALAVTALVKWGDTSEDVKKKTEELTEAQKELNSAYTEVTNTIVDEYDDAIAQLNATETDQKVILEETLELRQKEYEALLQNYNVLDGNIKVRKDDIAKTREEIVELRRRLAASKEYYLQNKSYIENEKELQAEIERKTQKLKNDEEAYNDLRKAQLQVIESQKNLNEFNKKAAEDEISSSLKRKQDLISNSNLQGVYTTELNSTLNSIDEYIKSQIIFAFQTGKSTKALEEQLERFRSNAQAVQEFALAIDVIKDQFSIIPYEISKGFINDLLPTFERFSELAIEITNPEFFKAPEDFINAAISSLRDAASKKMGLIKSIYEELFLGGIGTEGGITTEEISNQLRPLFEQINKDANSSYNVFDSKEYRDKLKKAFNLSDNEVGIIINKLQITSEKIARSFGDISEQIISGMFTPAEFIKNSQQNISEIEKEYANIVDDLSHQNDILKASGSSVTTQELQRVDAINQQIDALNSLQFAVEGSFISDDEKSKKTEEITKKIKELRQELELLEIRLGKKPNVEAIEGLSEETKKELKVAEDALRVFSQFTNDLGNIFEQYASNRLTALESAQTRANESLQSQYEAGLLSQEQYQAKSLALDKEYQAKIRIEKKKAWRNQKAADIATATIGVANAVINGLQTQPFPLGVASAALAGALGAVQIGVIASQPEPEFAQGGYVVGPGGPKDDAINAKLSNGEYVINSKSTSAFLPLLEAINNAQFNGISTPKQSPAPVDNKPTSPIAQKQDLRVNLVWKDVDNTSKTANNIKIRTTF